MKPLILPLKKIRKEDAEITGAKAFHLSELLKRDLPVPRAFVLTTQAFDLFFQENNLFYLVERLSTEHARNVLDEICRELKKRIRKGVFPKNLEEEIKKEIKRSDFTHFAVRSSATSEDLAFASFAGQFESYLNISPEKIFDYIKTCWQSLYEERVTSYTLYHQIPMHEIKMAVLVQEMIPAEKGGVIFTKDVLRDDERMMIIEAAKGLGTRVVAGTVEPDRYIVEKSDLKTISKRLKGKTQVLEEEEIFQLASLGLMIENFYRSPQDIEWLIKDNQVFLLQARPITV